MCALAVCAHKRCVLTRTEHQSRRTSNKEYGLECGIKEGFFENAIKEQKSETLKILGEGEWKGWQREQSGKSPTNSWWQDRGKPSLAWTERTIFRLNPNWLPISAVLLHLSHCTRQSVSHVHATPQSHDYIPFHCIWDFFFKETFSLCTKMWTETLYPLSQHKTSIACHEER